MARVGGTPPVRWTEHALASLIDRGIPRDAADAAIERPQRIESQGGTREVRMRRFHDAALDQAMLQRVVLEMAEQEWIVITAYKTSRIAKYLPDGPP